MAWMLDNGYSQWIAIPGSVVIGLAIGVLTGWLVAKVGIPSFVVTLAFFLSWQGVVLMIAKEGGTIAVNNDFINDIANKNLSPLLGWLLWAVAGRRLSRAEPREGAPSPGQQLGRQPAQPRRVEGGGTRRSSGASPRCC